MAPYVLSWGIIGCGWISSSFAKDLCLARDAEILHAVAAVGSRDVNKAEKFIADFLPNGATAQAANLKPAPKAYGSYEGVFSDPNVDVVYIGTLHPTHYDDARAALEAGKHVLVEKPATLNAAEWADLCRIAKKHNRYLMEAFWTRFQPAVAELFKLLHEDKAIGDIRAVQTNFSVPNYNVLPDDHRIVGLAAAGGPLLDLGAYAMVPARIALSENPANAGQKPEVTTAMSMTRMGTDLATTIVLDYPTLDARAVCNMDFNARSPRDNHATIVGTKGEIVIHDVLCRIERFSVTSYVPGEEGKRGTWGESKKVEYSIPGIGLGLEADAVARDIRDGKTENELISHQYTLETLEIFDESRRQGKYILPEGMEKLGQVA